MDKKITKNITKANLWNQLEFFAVELFSYIFEQLKNNQTKIKTAMGEVIISDIKENWRVSWTNQISDIRFTLNILKNNGESEKFEFLIESKAYFSDLNSSDISVLKNLDSILHHQDLLGSVLNKAYWSLYVIFRPAESSIGNLTLRTKLEHCTNCWMFFPDYWCEITNNSWFISKDIETLCSGIKTIIKAKDFKQLQQNETIRMANKAICLEFILNHKTEVQEVTRQVIEHLTQSMKAFEHNDLRIDKMLETFKDLKPDIKEFKENTENGFLCNDTLSINKYNEDLNNSSLAHQRYWASKRRFMTLPLFQKEIQKIEEKIKNDLIFFKTPSPITELQDYIINKITTYFLSAFDINDQEVFKVVFDSPITNTGVIFFLWSQYHCHFKYENNEINFIIWSK